MKLKKLSFRFCFHLKTIMFYKFAVFDVRPEKSVFQVKYKINPEHILSCPFLTISFPGLLFCGPIRSKPTDTGPGAPLSSQLKPTLCLDLGRTVLTLPHVYFANPSLPPGHGKWESRSRAVPPPGRDCSPKPTKNFQKKI